MEYLHIDDEIHLEKIKKAHAAGLFSIIDHDREYLRRWLPFVDYTLQVRDTEKFIGLLLSGENRDRQAVYTVWYRGELAGLAGFKDIDPVNHKAEIGYWLAEHLQGRGIMTKTVRKMIDFAFRNMKMNRIQIKVAVGNHRSVAIPRRLGLFFEGTERAGEFHANHYKDLENYSQLKSEWVTALLNPAPDHH